MKQVDSGAFEKLPKWARDKITQLERDLNEAKTELDNVKDATGYKDTPIRWFQMGDISRKPYGIPRHSRVVFNLNPETERKDITVNYTMDNDVPCVRVSGERSISIVPVASNVVLIFPNEV